MHHRCKRVLLIGLTVVCCSLLFTSVSASPGNERDTCSAKDKICHTRHRSKRSFIIEAQPVGFGLFQDEAKNDLQLGFPPGMTLEQLLPEGEVFGMSYADIIRRKHRECVRQAPPHGDVNCLWVKLKDVFNMFEGRYRGDNPWDPVITKDDPFPLTKEDLSIAYTYVICSHDENQHGFCPDHCLNENPCSELAHTATSECTTVGTGLWFDDYVCDCQLGYRFQRDSRLCERVDVCKTPAVYPCHVEGTAGCTMTEDSYICDCKPEWMGEKCDEARNACEESSLQGQPSGREACGAGACKPIIGTPQYACSCLVGMTDDPSSEWLDCDLEDDLCNHMECVNGHCVSSRAMAQAACVCEEGFTGDHCDMVLPHWSSWGEWEACDPTCGYTRRKRRVRTCLVTDYPGHCTGEAEQFDECTNSICKVDGIWIEWSPWSACSLDCGGGEQVRTRECHYETPYGEDGWGDPCLGDGHQSQACHTHACPTDAPPPTEAPEVQLLIHEMEQTVAVDSAGFASWQAWSECSSDCGEGERYRLRQCTRGRYQCAGSGYEAQTCQTDCPPGQQAHGAWSAWSRCSEQSVTACTRERRCESAGLCVGVSEQRALCVEGLCDGEYRPSILQVQQLQGPLVAEALAHTIHITGIVNGMYRQAMTQDEYLASSPPTAVPSTSSNLHAGTSNTAAPSTDGMVQQHSTLAPTYDQVEGQSDESVTLPNQHVSTSAPNYAELAPADFNAEIQTVGSTSGHGHGHDAHSGVSQHHGVQNAGVTPAFGHHAHTSTEKHEDDETSIKPAAGDDDALGHIVEQTVHSSSASSSSQNVAIDAALFEDGRLAYDQGESDSAGLPTNSHDLLSDIVQHVDKPASEGEGGAPRVRDGDAGRKEKMYDRHLFVMVAIGVGVAVIILAGVLLVRRCKKPRGDDEKLEECLKSGAVDVYLRQQMAKDAAEPNSRHLIGQELGQGRIADRHRSMTFYNASTLIPYSDSHLEVKQRQSAPSRIQPRRSAHSHVQA